MIALDEMLRRAAEAGAGTLLLLVGGPPMMRVGRELQPPMEDTSITFNDTEQLVRELLTADDVKTLDDSGSIEVPFAIAGVTGRVSIFYGGGSHNLVFYLGAT